MGRSWDATACHSVGRSSDLLLALILVLLSPFGGLLCPAWSKVEHRRWLVIVDALTGEGAGRGEI
jgi:hypothetical protein